MEGKDTRAVSLELMQSIIDYLQTRPYSEVHILINDIIEQTKDKE